MNKSPMPAGPGIGAVFLVSDGATALMLARRLQAFFRCALGGDPSAWPKVSFSDAHETGDVLIAFGADFDRWAQRILSEPGARSAVYVQPELIVVAETFRTLWPDAGPRHDLWARSLSVDQRLRDLPTLRMETVHGGGDLLWESLSSALGIAKPDETPLPDADPQSVLEDYQAALRQLASPMTQASPAVTLPETGRFPVRVNGQGLRFLHRGWSAPEAEFTWSNSWIASLLIPPGRGGSRICSLTGTFAYHPERPVDAWVRVNGGSLAAVIPVGDGSLRYELKVALPPRRHHADLIEFILRNPFRPSDEQGSHDHRRLGMTLTEVQLDEHPAPELGPAIRALDDPLVARLISRERPRLTIVVAADQAAGTAAADVCGQLGCSMVIVPSEADDTISPFAWSLPVSAGVHLAGGRLETVAMRLREVDAQVDLAILCDRPSVDRWFGAVGVEPFRRVFDGASLVIASGDPYGYGRDFHWYASRCDARIEVSDIVTVAESWARL